MPFDEVGWALISRRAGIWRALRCAVPGRPRVARRCAGPRVRHRDTRRSQAPPHHVHLAGLRTEWLVLVDLGYLRLEYLTAQAPGTRKPATAGVSQALGTICSQPR